MGWRSITDSCRPMERLLVFHAVEVLIWYVRVVISWNHELLLVELFEVLRLQDSSFALFTIHQSAIDATLSISSTLLQDGCSEIYLLSLTSQTCWAWMTKSLLRLATYETHHNSERRIGFNNHAYNLKLSGLGSGCSWLRHSRKVFAPRYISNDYSLNCSEAASIRQTGQQFMILKTEHIQFESCESVGHVQP